MACSDLTQCLLVSSADSLCKQFGPRSGPTKCRATLIVFLKEFFEKVDFEKISRRQKFMKKIPGDKEWLIKKIHKVLDS